MKTKYAIIAVTIIVAAAFTSAKAFKENTPLFEANVEALTSPEAYQKGTGKCYKEYEFSLTALFLSCSTCRYYYGVPTFYWDTGNCD
jgi:hypothetical protein